MIKSVSLLKTNISYITIDSGLEEVVKWLKNGDKKYKIFTPNPEILTLTTKNPDFLHILNSADLALPDGSGLVFASKILGKPLLGRVSGVDFMQKLCEVSSKNGFTIGLIGGRQGIAVKASECLQKLYPKLKIAFAEAWNPEISVDRILHEKIPLDILFVAYGQGKQEFWIHQNLDKIPVKVAMGVGGAFDYFSGRIPRAPQCMRDHGLEWLYRLLRQPWRLKRQIIGGQFFLLVLKEWINSKILHVK
jgi:N-acetylglucosaminyldiphosphoundecaprenol N-acetyl-beta-D-mannosaminyltransferase